MFFFAFAALAMSAAVVGLLRLRAWGFLLNLVANVAIASVVWLFHVPRALCILLAATTAGQLIVAVPILRAMIVGDVEPGPMNSRRLSLIGSSVVLSIMLAASIRVLIG